MKRPDHDVRGQFLAIRSFVLAVSAAIALGGCAEPGALDEVEEGERALPSPGSIEVIRPLEMAPEGRVPEREEGFVSAELGEGRLWIEGDGRLRPFQPGEVLAGTAGGGYLVRVVAVRGEEAGRFVLDTAPASLTDLITEGEIKVQYDAARYAESLAEALEAARAEGEEDGELIGSRADALKLSTSPSLDLIKLAGAALPASCGLGAVGQADLDVSARLVPSIELDLAIGKKGGFDVRPEVKRLRLVASGTLEVDATLHATGAVVGSCQVDLLALAGGAPALALPPLTFWVGPVPVIVTTDVVPRAGARVDLAFEAADVVAEAHAVAGLSAGVDYEHSKWSPVWEPWAAASGSATVDAPGAITASCKVTAGAELRARLYGLIGPTVGVEAYARATAETAPPYCTYAGHTGGGVRAYALAEAGLAVGPLDLTLVSLPLMDYELCSFEGPSFSGKIPGAPASCGD